MKATKFIYLLLSVITLLWTAAIFPSTAATKPTIHALLVVMDGDARYPGRYEIDYKRIQPLLRDIQDQGICNLKLKTLSSASENDMERPTRNQVITWIKDVKPLPNDVIFVYFSGHGGQDTTRRDDGTFLALVGTDVLYRKDLVNILKSSEAWRCRLKILITDSCSGNGRGATRTTTSPAPDYNKASAFKNLFIEHEGFLHIASASPGEVAFGDSVNGGWFTTGLVRTIYSHADAAKRFVGWKEVFNGISEHVQESIQAMSLEDRRNLEHRGIRIRQNPKLYEQPDYTEPWPQDGDTHSWTPPSPEVPPNESANRIERIFDVNPNRHLTIDSDIGTIEVQTAARNRIEVVVTKQAKNRLDRSVQEALADFRVTFNQPSAGVTIRGKFQRGRNYWRRQLNQLKIRFQVTVPPQCDISVDGLADAVQAQTSTGNIHVDNIVGSVETQTLSGDLRFGSVKGRIFGRSTSGDITLANCEGPVDVKTTSGDIYADITIQPLGEWRLRTSSGDIVSTFISNIGFKIDAQTISGGISMDSRIQGTGNRRRFRGTIDRGGPLLKLHTTSGDIRLRRK